MPHTPLSESNVDVLIIGAGPAGLMAATWMAKCGVNARIIDKRDTEIFTGQADGLQCRTLEIFDSFGFGYRAWQESNHMLEICFWNPDENGQLYRNDRLPDTLPGISRFQQVVLHQGRIERFFLDAMQEFNQMRVERGVLPTSLSFDATKVGVDGYPITLHLRKLSSEHATPQQVSNFGKSAAEIPNGLHRSNLVEDDTNRLLQHTQQDSEVNTEEKVHAKYVIGADGARSWTRSQIGVRLEGDSTDYIWGVIDIVPITNFPDIRMRCAIHSASSGSMMVIPREKGLVRLYIQLSSAEAGSRIDRSHIRPETILATARQILAPYTIDYKILEWWTAYQIGQRVGSAYSAYECIFLVGDAVHTHSPKAGQGMNVSMQDAYNLGWKIASVVKGVASPSILNTYETERRTIALQLIEFDRRFSKLFSGRPTRNMLHEEGISIDDFKEAFSKGQKFVTGTGVEYGASAIVAGKLVEENTSRKIICASTPTLATGVTVGQRIPSVKVLNQADARPWHLHEMLPSDGRWRLLVFPGDIRKQVQKKNLEKLSHALKDATSFIHRFTPRETADDSVFELFLIHKTPRHEATIFDFPDIFHRFDEQRGYDYMKILVDDESYHEGYSKIYQNLGIGDHGCNIIVRPDQHVSYVGPLDDCEALNTFFESFMIAQE